MREPTNVDSLSSTKLHFALSVVVFFDFHKEHLSILVHDHRGSANLRCRIGRQIEVPIFRRTFGEFFEEVQLKQLRFLDLLIRKQRWT